MHVVSALYFGARVGAQGDFHVGVSGGIYAKYVDDHWVVWVVAPVDDPPLSFADVHASPRLNRFRGLERDNLSMEIQHLANHRECPDPGRDSVDYLVSLEDGRRACVYIADRAEIPSADYIEALIHQRAAEQHVPPSRMYQWMKVPGGRCLDGGQPKWIP